VQFVDERFSRALVPDFYKHVDEQWWLELSQVAAIPPWLVRVG
jgi:hypothetical protein